MPGPFYFAWVDAGTAFNDAVHNVEDELIFSFEIGHEEGEFPTLTIEVANPNVGLLSAGRKVWCWFSWFNGTSIEPLFHGRLVGIPDSITAEVVTLVFVARPIDYEPQKDALADTLRVAPYYNALWLSDEKRTDPDAVLEGYSKLWHIDRVSHDVTVSDIIVGEDGTIAPTPLQVFYDGLGITLNQVPLAQINIEATIGWDQVASQAFSLNPGIFDDPRAHKLLSEWPKPGQSLDGGWYVVNATAVDMLDSENAKTFSGSSSWETKVEKPNPGDTTSISMSWTLPENYYQVVDSRPEITDSSSQGGVVSTASASGSYVWQIRYKVQATLSIAYKISRGRSELLNIAVTSDFQGILTEPGDDQYETLALSAKAPSTSVAYFWAGDLGRISIEYLLCVARAKLLARARAVNVSFSCVFDLALTFSCRKNISLTAPRLPGGAALGKIISYRITGNGDTGEFIGECEFACTIGKGTSVAADPGTPNYVDENYVNENYQTYTGTIIVLSADDIGYYVPAQQIVDDGLTFPASKTRLISENKTSAAYELTLRKLDTGPFSAEYNLVTLPLVAPKQIDLEAGP